MKSKASNVVKQVISLLSSMAKGKIMGVKSRVVAIKARLIVFQLLKDKRPSLGSLSHKINALLDRNKSTDTRDQEEDTHLCGESKAIVLYSSGSGCLIPIEGDHNHGDYDDDVHDDNKFPDLTHSLFEDDDPHDDELEPQGGEAVSSVIDLVKNSKQDQGADFILENEIDHVADLFIKRFRKQIRLQKLESFKRYQAMLDRSV